MYHVYKYVNFSWEPLYSTPLKHRAFNYAKGISFKYVTKILYDETLLATYYLGSDYVDETV